MSTEDPPTEGFLRATEITPRVPRTAGGSTCTYHARIANGWDIFGNANGGYLLAIAARAMTDATQRIDPITITGHFLAPGRTGDLDVELEVVREGRQFATSRATLLAGETPLVLATGICGDLSTMSGPTMMSLVHPELPPPEDCIFDSAFSPRFAQRVDMRFHPEDVEYLNGAPSGTMQMRGWFRLRNEEPLDTIALICVGDAFPPTIFNAGLPPAWTPTLEYTVHVRRRPAPGWLACAFETRALDHGFLEEDGTVWDSEGQLVAQTRQLAIVGK